MQKLLMILTVVLATAMGTTGQADSLSKAMLFTNLGGKEVEWPKELPGKKTVILLAYKRGQQAAVEDWVAQMGFSPSDNFIQVLLMGRGARFVKGMIDGGLKKAFATQEWQERTYTIYQKAAVLNKPFGISGTKSMQVIVLREDGKILGKVSGAADAGQIKQVKSWMK